MSTEPRLPLQRLHLPPVDDDVALRHELLDFSDRARMGGIFYVAGGLATAIAHQMHSRQLWLFVIVTLVFLLCALLRLRRPPPDLDSKGARRWISQLWMIIWVSTGLWGLGAAWIVATTSVETARILALFMIVACSTTLSHIYAMRFRHCALAVGLMCAPALVVLSWKEADRILVISLLIYFVYLMLVLRRSRAEYWQRVGLEEQTLRQRDFFEQQSRRDGLTGLPNRRRFDAVLNAMLGRQHDVAVSLILFNIDHFKAINDRYGHAVGDRCLLHFASLLNDHFSTADQVPARVGGEEFAVVLFNCGLAEASSHAERIRQALADNALQHNDQPVSLTVSGGVVCAAAHEDAASLFVRADSALYAAKRSGRDRIVGAQQMTSPKGTQFLVDTP